MTPRRRLQQGNDASVTVARSRRSLGFHPEIIVPLPSGRLSRLHNDANRKENDAQEAPPSSAPTGVGGRLSPGVRSAHEALVTARKESASVAARQAPPHAVAFAAPPAAGAIVLAAPLAASIRGRRPGFHVARELEHGRRSHLPRQNL